jgi:hypothetical protein
VDTRQTSRQRLRTALVRRETLTLAGVTVGLAVGLGLLWFVKRFLEIDSDAVFVALLLVPLVVHLAYTGKLGKLSELSLFGVTAKFTELVEGVEKRVVETGQREATRSAYLGKLQQVLVKNGREFCLLYADADGLRQVTRRRYLEQPADPPMPSGPVAAAVRRSEEAIRHEIIDRLELALTDAFFATDPRLTKCDFFRLEEPDIVMIARTLNSDQADEIAAKAIELFRGDGFEATITVLAVANETGDPPPDELDRRAANRHTDAKKAARGRVTGKPPRVA